MFDATFITAVGGLILTAIAGIGGWIRGSQQQGATQQVQALNALLEVIKELKLEIVRKDVDYATLVGLHKECTEKIKMLEQRVWDLEHKT